MHSTLVILTISIGISYIFCEQNENEQRIVVIADIGEDMHSIDPEVLLRDERAKDLVPPFARIGKRRAKPFLPIIEKDVDKLIQQPLAIVDWPLFLHLGPKPNKLPPGLANQPKNEEESAIRRFQKYLKMRHDYN